MTETTTQLQHEIDRNEGLRRELLHVAELADAIVEAWEHNVLPPIPGEGPVLRGSGYKEIGAAVAAYRAAAPRTLLSPEEENNAS